ncbi:MAG: hypothetical protein M1319_01105, partial [Chloroflexi bacterium]|nr:hypothetical protein [Chloroflexota bacterium]
MTEENITEQPGNEPVSAGSGVAEEPVVDAGESEAQPSQADQVADEPLLAAPEPEEAGPAPSTERETEWENPASEARPAGPTREERTAAAIAHAGIVVNL